MKGFTLLSLVTAVSAVDYQYYTSAGCTGTYVGGGTLACGKNTLPLSPAIHGIGLLYANGYRTAFYTNRDCSGSPWFVDDGTGGCVTDSSAKTNCINVPC